MQSESTNFKNGLQCIHKIPAGVMPGDSNIELFADRQTRKVYFTRNGETKPFAQIPGIIKGKLLEKLLNDDKAMSDLNHLTANEALEEYAFCLYGSADHLPDVGVDGELQNTDNFRCGNQCKCLLWDSKRIDFNGYNLTGKQIRLIDLLKTGQPDKSIALELGIAQVTLDQNKKRLFGVFGVQSKLELIMAATAAKIIQ